MDNTHGSPAPEMAVAEDVDVRDFNTGGIACEITVYKADAPMIIERLMACGHSHVFVVDQSRAHTGLVRLGVSAAGLRCATDATLASSST